MYLGEGIFVKIYDREIFAVSQIHFSSKSKVKENGSASGFFFEHRDLYYFITNRHVIVDIDRDHHPDKLSLNLHIDEEDLSQNRVFKIPLYDDKDLLWLEHPQNYDGKINKNELIDLVALQLRRRDINDYIIKPFRSDKDLLPETEDFLSSGVKGFIGGYSIWERLLVIGYPEGIYDSANNLPIIRSATVASAIGVPFNRKPKFIIDAQLHEGTSGSPVLVKPYFYYDEYGYNNSNFPDNGKEGNTYLLGIHSGEYDQRYPYLGLHNVWFARLILDIITQNSDYFKFMECKL